MMKKHGFCYTQGSAKRKERQRWPVTTSPFKGHQPSSVRENQIAEIGREILPQITNTHQKMVQLHVNKVKNPHDGANDARCVMHKDGKDRSPGQYGSRVSHECHKFPNDDNGLFKTAKKQPPPEAGALGLIKPQSLGVRNAAILQAGF